MKLRYEAFSSAVAASLLMTAAGALGLALRQPWLFPSLGPSAFLHVYEPRRETTGIYHTIAGHFIGVGAGYAAVLLLHASSAPAVMASEALTPARLWASSLAVFLTVMLQIAADALHPPATATTLLIALGAFKPTWRDAGALLAGVVVIACLGAAAETILERRRGAKRARIGR